MARKSDASIPSDLNAVDLLRIIWPQKATVFLFAVVAFILCIAFIFMQPRTYESEALLQVKSSKLVATGGQPIVISNKASSEDLYHARRTILSDEVLAHIVDKLDLENSTEFNLNLNPGLLDRLMGSQLTPAQTRAAVTNVLKHKIDLDTPEGSNLIEITVSSWNAERAAQITTILMQRYLSAHAKDMLEEAAITRLQEPIDVQIERLRALAGALEYSADTTPEALEETLGALLETSDLALSSYAMLLSNLDVLTGAMAPTELAKVPMGPNKLFAEQMSIISTPTKPTSRKLALFGTLALILGMVAGALYVLARSFAKPPVRDIEDARRRFDVPLWGTLPGTPRAAQTEPYRDLRSSILLSGAGTQDPAQVLLMSSATPQMSMGTHALHLAQSYQAMGKSVLVIDADMRASALVDQFGNAHAGNLAALLEPDARLEDIACTAEGVPLVLGGQGLPETVEAFSSGRFAALLDTLRKSTDVIILAAPPVPEVSDAAVLQSLSDACLLGVHPGQTLMQHIDASLMRLETDPPKPLGICAIQ